MVALTVVFYRTLISTIFVSISLAAISLNALAQDVDATESLAPSNSTTAQETAAPAPQAARGGVVSLQTTVTGNQEQPQVLYILPWQSPPASEIDFELLNNQQKSVFGHVERIELRRQLESSGALD